MIGTVRGIFAAIILYGLITLTTGGVSLIALDWYSAGEQFSDLRCAVEVLFLVGIGTSLPVIWYALSGLQTLCDYHRQPTKQIRQA